MLDFFKRSRSGKFRFVIKFKKEKNSRNREARSFLGVSGIFFCFFVGCSSWGSVSLFFLCFWVSVWFL